MNRGYTLGMKTAISLDDQTFHAAEAYAQRMGLSRSELYRAALRKFLKEQEAQAVTEAYDRLADALTADDHAETAQVVAAGKRTLERGEW